MLTKSLFNFQLKTIYSSIATEAVEAKHLAQLPLNDIKFIIMKITFTYATLKEIPWLTKKDTHLNELLLKKKVADREVIIAKENNNPVGWLRFGFFWDEIPFMNMLFINKEYRSKGIGKKLVEFWESEMKEQKHKMVMTSSQSDEEAQHFYRKLGYADAGSLTFPKEPLEIIFLKKV